MTAPGPGGVTEGASRNQQSSPPPSLPSLNPVIADGRTCRGDGCVSTVNGIAGVRKPMLCVFYASAGLVDCVTVDKNNCVLTASELPGIVGNTNALNDGKNEIG